MVRAGPQKQISPHHEPLPAAFQTTLEGRAAAEAYHAPQHPPASTTDAMAPKLAITDVLALPNSAVRIPRLGFGVYLSPERVCVASCLHALRHGYRHIDTAQYYQNEAEVGTAVRESGLRREDVFLTTKILAAAGSPEKTYRRCADSVAKLDPRAGGFVDLFLIHSPSGGTSKRKEMWGALERLLQEGKARSIGVSNYGVGHIEEMKGYAAVWPPHVNQIELHPWCQQRTISAYCATHGIVVEAYSPLVRAQKAHDPTLVAVARQSGKTTAQVLIRYCLQKGWVPLPKSDTPSRIEENADVYDFELSAEDMKQLDELDMGADGAIVQAVTNE
ncbi:hypothetical protein MMC34_001442 [Xylographa carneopallida]|nr:hypothetical protein [Xylographa carneopallida]